MYRFRQRQLVLYAALIFVLVVIGGGFGRAEALDRTQGWPPLALLPENPRYFLFRGLPTVLITSGEHYGAVVNRDFDYIPYLDELARHGFNQTRLFSGSYLEFDAFIPGLGYDNPLAPRPGRAIVPWARSDVAGAAEGGYRFDLTRWDPDYFDRLRRFVEEAGRRGIVVEIVLFSVHYHGANWLRSPLHPANNVNGTPPLSMVQIYREEGQELLPYQRELARKLVRELRDYDNVYFEILNEPHYACVPVEDACEPDAWHDELVAAVRDEQARTQSRHLIAQNVPVGRVSAPDPRVSVFNFHYATPLDVLVNAGLRRPLVYDETGQEGAAAAPYRIGAWRFMLSGGSGVSHLDFSFGPSDEQGTLPPERYQVGGGGHAIRTQLAVLKRFFARFDLRRLRPSAVVRAHEPDELRVSALSDGRTYGIYVENGTRAALRLDLRRGNYDVEWLSTKTERVLRKSRLRHAGGEVDLTSPRYEHDVALTLRRR